MTTGRTIVLTRRTFVGKVVSLLSGLVITFLPRSKSLLISWLRSPSAVILEPRKIKSATVSPSICHEVMIRYHDLSFLNVELWANFFTLLFHFHALEEEMATHPSVLAWRIPGTGEPGGLLSMGSHRVRHDWSDLAAAAADWSYLSFQGGSVF